MDFSEMSDKDPHMTETTRIAAFADGELAGEDNLRLLEASQNDPQVAAAVRHQHQLRQACQRSMTQPRQCPEALRAQVTALAEQVGEASSPSPVLARIGRWMPAAVAAVLLFAAVALYQQNFSPSDKTLDAMFVASEVERYGKRHEICSTELSRLIDDPELPHELTALPAALQSRFGQPVPALDLSSLGYTFARVGKCHLPGRNSVHLVYQADPASGHDDAISLWMRPDDGRLPIKPGVPYARTGTTPQHRMLVWKQGGMVYYLFGDDPGRLDNVARSLAPVG